MKNKSLILFIFCLVVALFASCADDDTEYSTEPDPQYEITYLLTTFEANPLQWSNRNAESIYRAEQDTAKEIADDLYNGWHYTYDDRNTPDDVVFPHALESNWCKDPVTETELVPYPDACDVRTGYQQNTANPFPWYKSTTSFHLHGTVVGAGVGFGTYFSDYEFSPEYSSTDPNRLLRNRNGMLAATFSATREKVLGNQPCMDDLDFAGTVDPAFYLPTRIPFNPDILDTDSNGMAVPKGKYNVTGSIYTRGKVWVDESGIERYALDYEHIDTLKEPRCLADMGQEGFVFWATGDVVIEVQLIVPETAPLDDGGLCDEQGGEKCYDHLTATFQLDDKWRQYHASWDEFVQEGWGKAVVLDPNKVINIQFKVRGPKTFGLAKKFDVWLDNMGFYGGQPWPFTAAMTDTSM